MNSYLKDIRCYTDNSESNESDKNISQVLSAAKQVGHAIKVSKENSHELEIFADTLITKDFQHSAAIDVYLAILKEFPLSAVIYKKILQVYFYDIKKVSTFDFLGLLAKIDINPESLESIYYALSCTYAGKLLQHLGLFDCAYSAYNMALQQRKQIPEHCYIASYEKNEINFLMHIAKKTCEPTNVKCNNAPDKQRLVLGTVFFGETYTKLFTSVAGPSFFCSQNLDIINKHWDPVLYIFCTESDRNLVLNSYFYRFISDNISVQIEIIPDYFINEYPGPKIGRKNYNPEMVYSVSGLLQTALFTVAKNWEADLINLPPDAIYANSAMQTTLSAESNGYKVVFSSGLRLNRADVMQQFKNSNLGLDVCALTRLGLKNLHPSTKASFMSNHRITYPGIMLWPNKEQGFFMHCFQMHPHFISHNLIKDAAIRRFDSIDGDFTHSLLPHEQDWDANFYVVKKPEELMQFELSGEQVSFDKVYDPNNLKDAARPWIGTHMRALNFWLLKNQIVIGNTGGCSTKDYQHAEDLVRYFEGIKGNIPTLKKSELLKISATASMDFAKRLRNYDGNLLCRDSIKRNTPRASITLKSFFKIQLKNILFKILRKIILIIPVPVKQKIMKFLKNKAIKRQGIWGKIFYNYQKRRALSPETNAYD